MYAWYRCLVTVFITHFVISSFWFNGKVIRTTEHTTEEKTHRTEERITERKRAKNAKYRWIIRKYMNDQFHSPQIKSGCKMGRGRAEKKRVTSLSRKTKKQNIRRKRVAQLSQIICQIKNTHEQQREVEKRHLDRVENYTSIWDSKKEIGQKETFCMQTDKKIHKPTVS